MTQDELRKLVRCCRVTLSADIEEPPYLLERNGQGVLPLEGLIAIKGKAKMGKSQAATIIMAALLGDDSFGLGRREGSECTKVIYLDTEQANYDTQLLGKRLHRINGWSDVESVEAFQLYNIRQLDFDCLMSGIEIVLLDEHPTVLVVDGIADLVTDINSSTEAKLCVNQLLKWTTQYHCSIICLIHENKGNDDKAMRGHLGTWLLNKASDVFEISREGNGPFTLKHVTSRGPLIDPITWIHDGDDLVSSDSKAKEKALVALFSPIFKKSNFTPLAYSTLKALFQDLHKGSDATFKRKLAAATELGIIEKDSLSRWCWAHRLI